MKKYNVFNYHITNRCNYHCTYCFGKFDGQRDPSLQEAKSIIDSIDTYFKENQISDGRINLAGGEPTLYEYLDELIEYASSLGIKVSIVTNGALLTAERIHSWRGKVSCIGISIDSLIKDTNLKIGRCCKNNVIELSHLEELSAAMHECDIDLKINTVVSMLNLDEDFSQLYKSLMPQKIKLFQMHLVEGINDKAKPYRVTDDEFNHFCDRHVAFASIVVSEPCGSMENSYLMINPEGKFQLNDNGKYQTFGDLNTTTLSELLKTVPLDREKFNSRYMGEAVE